MQFGIKQSQEPEGEDVLQGLFGDDEGDKGESKPTETPKAETTPLGSPSASSANIPLPEPKAAAPLETTPKAAAPAEVATTPTSIVTPLAPQARSTTSYGTTEMLSQPEESQMQ